MFGGGGFAPTTTAGTAPTGAATSFAFGSLGTAQTSAPAFGAPAPSGGVFSFGNIGAASTAPPTASTGQPALNLSSTPAFGSLSGAFTAPTATAAPTQPAGNSLFGAASSTGGGFAFNSPTTAATGLGAPPAFGSTPTLGLNKPASVGAISFGTPTPSTAAAPSTGLQFSTGTSANTALNFASPATTVSTGLSLGGTSGGGFSFGTSAPAAVAPTPSTGFNFQGTATPAATSLTPAASKPTSTAAFSIPTTSVQPLTSTAPAFGSGGSFMAKTTSTVATTVSAAAAAPTLAASLNFGASPATTSAIPAAPSSATGTLGQGLNLTTSTSTASGTVKSSEDRPTTFARLEETMNTWAYELEEQEKSFLTAVTQVNAWDRLLLESGDKITAMDATMDILKAEQQKVDLELDYITSQERELEESIGPLEKAVESMPGSDPERQHIYELSENLEGQTKQMAEDLKEIIDHLNELNRAQDESNPVVQIGRILNAHMNSLQWIDQTASSTQTQLEEVSKMIELQKKELERPYNLTGYNI